MKTPNLYLMILCAFAICSAFGCAALSHLITPADLDARAVDYVVDAGVADANDFKGYANLEKAVKLEKAVHDAFQLKQLQLDQLADDNNLLYTQLNKTTMANRKQGFEKEERLFGKTGLALILNRSLLPIHLRAEFHQTLSFSIR